MKAGFALTTSKRTERIVVVGLALAAAIVALAMLGPHRAIAVTSGNYKGVTEQGLPVQFEVVADKVGNLFYKVRIKPKCNQPSGWRPGSPESGIDGYGTRGTPSPPAKVKNRKFRLKNTVERSLPPLAKGKFVTKRKVKGELAYGCVSNRGETVLIKYVTFKAKKRA